MSIKETKTKYKNNEINKIDFVNKMHDFHKVLFDFSENLRGTEIFRIEILDGQLIYTTRETDYHPGGCSFFVDVLDKRITPIDTFNFDLYEQSDSKLLFDLINDGDIIFDIGANIGWYSCHFARKLPKSVIYSFEPIPETFRKLQMNVELNNFSNLVLNNLALSSKIEKTTFFYSPTVTGASSAKNITENEDMQRIECITDTVDNFSETFKIDRLDFIKCDVEGAEIHVFQGGLETLNKCKPIIFTEMLRKWTAKFGYTPNDIIQLLKEIGYQCFICENDYFKVIENVTEDTIQTNFFFLNTEKHKSIINQYSLNV